MKNANKPTIKERLSSLLDLPGDLAYDDCMVTLVGKRELLIENYRNILEYDTDHLLILTSSGRIRIHGTSLLVCYYTEFEMKVTGQITAIFYEK